MVKQIVRLHLHRHPLVLVEAQGDENEKEKADCIISTHSPCFVELFHPSFVTDVFPIYDDHVLLHKYFLEKGQVGDCQICFEQVKEGCNCVVHVKCVLEDDSMYRVVDRENEDGDDDASDSSITSVIKVDDLGQAVEVQHFNHDHNLVLQDNITATGGRLHVVYLHSILSLFRV
ncbi:hypothetical protein GQ457_06G023710 [Hibiscus cannabinus]